MRKSGIMLLEDNDDHADLIMEILKNKKAVGSVVRFSNAEEALSYLRNREQVPSNRKQCFPNIILIDIKLPGMSGLELLAKLKRSARTKRIPAIILTSSGRKEEIDESYEKGAAGYIVKPVNLGEFERKMERFGEYWGQTAELPRPSNNAPVAT